MRVSRFFFFLSKKEVETGHLVTMEKNELLKATVILSPYFLIIGTYFLACKEHRLVDVKVERVAWEKNRNLRITLGIQ